MSKIFMWNFQKAPTSTLCKSTRLCKNVETSWNALKSSEKVTSLSDLYLIIKLLWEKITWFSLKREAHRNRCGFSMQYNIRPCLLFIYHILGKEMQIQSTLKGRVCPQIVWQAVPESGRIQTKSSLNVDVNCQHRLTSCHSVSDYQDALITGTALQRDMNFTLQKWNNKICKVSVKREPLFNGKYRFLLGLQLRITFISNESGYFLN